MSDRLEFSSIAAADAVRFNVAGYGGTRLASYRLRGQIEPQFTPRASSTNESPSGKPVLLWAHANGLCAGSYLPILRPLCEHFAVYSYDVRGHGGSECPPAPINAHLSFDIFAEDLRAVTLEIQRRETGPMFFAGHSFSAAAMFHLGGNLGFAPWQAVTTFDATMMPSDDAQTADHARETGRERVARTLRRRKDFEDVESYGQQIGRPGAFDTWTPEMLSAHAHASVKVSGDGVTLACLPEVEAGVYRAVMDDAPYRGLANFQRPAHLIGADATANGTWVGGVQAQAAAILPRGTVTVMSGCGHMMPFEQPQKCVEFICAMLADQSISEQIHA